MNFNSIKVRLQVWYGLILVAVLAGLGVTAFELEKSKVQDQVDVSIKEHVRLIADALNGPEGGGRGPDDRPGDESPGPPPDHGMDRPPERVQFRLSSLEAGHFGASNREGFYFAVFNPGGRIMASSDNFPAAASQTENPLRPGAVTRGSNREISIVTPTRERIVVGRSVVAESQALRLTGITLCLVGGVILLCGLSVGGWIVARALRPIADISTAAEKISSGDMTQRINVAETKSELGRLAFVLNSMFARMEAAFTQQRRFAADAAHELRTPVATLIAQTHAALKRPRSPEENLQTIEACHRAGQRMRRLIQSLLELTRLDAGQENANRTTFDLSELAEECVEHILPLAEERGVKIIQDTAPARVFGDPGQFAQLITNLATNAIQYNRAGGEVRLNIRAESGHVILAVADTGQGIPSVDVPHIFERFYRADKSRSSGNAGLGLAISQAVVTAHGGTIEVETRENAGTIFTVRLPAAQK